MLCSFCVSGDDVDDDGLKRSCHIATLTIRLLGIMIGEPACSTHSFHVDSPFFYEEEHPHPLLKKKQLMLQLFVLWHCCYLDRSSSSFFAAIITFWHSLPLQQHVSFPHVAASFVLDAVLVLLLLLLEKPRMMCLIVVLHSFCCPFAWRIVERRPTLWIVVLMMPASHRHHHHCYQRSSSLVALLLLVGVHSFLLPFPSSFRNLVARD